MPHVVVGAEDDTDIEALCLDRQAAPGARRGLRPIPIEGGPHSIGWTHPEVVDPALLEFIAA